MKRGGVVRHGMSDSSEYNCWLEMRARCKRPSHKNYKHYGGRGIVVCDEWDSDFAAFFGDMGPKPTPEHTLDRIDNNGGYNKNNCAWVTRTEQGNNKRSNIIVEVGDVRGSVAEVCRALGLRNQLVYHYAHQQGKTHQEVLDHMVSKRKHNNVD